MTTPFRPIQALRRNDIFKDDGIVPGDRTFNDMTGHNLIKEVNFKLIIKINFKDKKICQLNLSPRVCLCYGKGYEAPRNILLKRLSKTIIICSKSSFITNKIKWLSY